MHLLSCIVEFVKNFFAILELLKKHPSIIPISVLIFLFMFYVPLEEYAETLLGLLMMPLCTEGGTSCKDLYEYLFQ